MQLNELTSIWEDHDNTIHQMCKTNEQFLLFIGRLRADHKRFTSFEIKTPPDHRFLIKKLFDRDSQKNRGVFIGRLIAFGAAIIAPEAVTNTVTGKNMNKQMPYFIHNTVYKEVKINAINTGVSTQVMVHFYISVAITLGLGIAID